MPEFNTELSDLLVNLVRCVRSHVSVPLPPFINPESVAKNFALQNPTEAEKMIAELYTLVQAYVMKRYR